MVGLFFILIISSISFVIFYLPINIMIKVIVFVLIISILRNQRNYILEKYKNPKFLKYSILVCSTVFILTIPYIYYINQKVEKIRMNIPIKYKYNFDGGKKSEELAFSLIAQLPLLFIADFILLLFIIVLLVQIKKKKNSNILDE